jgi:hypothetical protein
VGVWMRGVVVTRMDRGCILNEMSPLRAQDGSE